MTQQPVIEVAGQTLLLHPDRAVEWREQRTLIVADTHFGKSSIFGRHGVAVPGGTDSSDRDRIARLVQRTGAARLLILGDFLHAALHADDPEAVALTAWCRSLAPLVIQVIAGNHDRHVLKHWKPPVDWLEGTHVERPFAFVHESTLADLHGGTPFTLSGHVHPVVRLAGLHKKAPRVPVFWQRRNGLVLPAFGSFTGGSLVSAGMDERIFAVGPERVVPFLAPRRRV